MAANDNVTVLHNRTRFMELCFRCEQKTAVWQLGFKLWALATPVSRRDDTNCAKGMSSVLLCDDCKGHTVIADFLTPEGKERLASGFSVVNRAQPDFDAAVLYFEPIIDKPQDVVDGVHSIH